MKRVISTLFWALILWLPAVALDFQQDVRFHCAQDTLVVNELLGQLRSTGGDPGERAALVLESFIGKPYAAHTLEGEREVLTIDVCDFDCMTLVQSVAAIVKASGRPNPTWRDMAYALEDIRYRRGNMRQYPSRLHYTADWIADNVYRGNLKEITENLPGATDSKKSLDYMTRHAELYPALKDSANYAGVRDVENGYRLHKMPYVRKESLSKRDATEMLRTGDIVVFQSREPGLDASHVGFIVMQDGVPYLVHASSAEKRVVKGTRPLSDYLKHEGRAASGVRILRLE